MLGELGGDAWQVGLAVEGEPDGGTGAVEVVQVLAVEEDGLAGEQDPVDAISATVGRGAGRGGFGGVARGLEAGRRGRRPSAR